MSLGDQHIQLCATPFMMERGKRGEGEERGDGKEGESKEENAEERGPRERGVKVEGRVRSKEKERGNILKIKF